ncbi:TPA: hypothetical protein N2G28_004197 [Salmonella enterica]|nr:hypothetical protein [Salmonella enterica]
MTGGRPSKGWSSPRFARCWYIHGATTYRHIKKAKMNIDYHAEYEQNYYPVTHQCIGHKVELHAFDNLLEV